jgi:cell wall-associated NlpC family hydrolase
MTAITWPPTAGAAARPGVAAGGWSSGGGRGEAGAARLGLPASPAAVPAPASRVGRGGRVAGGDGARPGRAVAFALGQRGKPYRWGAEGPHAFDCSGLTWAAWRAAGVTIPRTAAGQLDGLPRASGRLQPGDLLIYRSRGPSRRHVALVVGPGRMVEALGRGIPVRSTSIRGGWLGAVRPGAGR